MPYSVSSSLCCAYALCMHSYAPQAAVQESDAVVTVSPGYAKEIQGDALLTVVRNAQRVQKPVLGIMNGIDTATWSPGVDPYLLPALRYGKGQAAAVKALAKLQLQVRVHGSWSRMTTTCTPINTVAAWLAV